jgi:hypothetical protein
MVATGHGHHGHSHGGGGGGHSGHGHSHVSHYSPLLHKIVCSRYIDL